MALKDHLMQLVSPTSQLAVKGARNDGDRLRDAGKFAEAAEAYDTYLVSHPDDFGIWVQRGNCLKDSGSYTAAKMAYEQAVKLNPLDADVHLQLGHLLKLQGKKSDAVKYYKKSLELNPNLPNVVSELRRLGVKMKEPSSPLETPAFAGVTANILDISDLLVFLTVHTRVTGIQRVQSCIVQEILNDRHQSGGFAAKDTLFCYCDQDTQTFYAVSADALSELIGVLSSTWADRHRVDEALRSVYGSKVKINPRIGDIYIILGAFWIGSDYSSSLLRLKDVGVKVGVYIYDLIPITHPQFVTESTRQDVIDKFGDVMSLADFALTISEYVAKEVIYVLRTELNRTIPVLAVPLSHILPEPQDADEGEVDEEFKSSLPKEFVLCVCTLEGRKNHLILLNSWISLNRKYNGKIPSLVLVGKWGWRIEEFREQLTAAKNVDGRIVVLGNLSDQELKYLYQRCLFTVFPSFVEGWGLPVGESLAYGKPCVASNTSSIPEVGGEFCRYINPYDPVGTLETLERTMMDRDGLKTWTDHVSRDFKVRTWSDVASNFMAQLAKAALAVPATQAPAITLQPGRVYRLTKKGIYGDSSSWRDRAVKFVCSQGWYPIEEWGVWSSRRIARLAFGTTAPAGAKVRILVQLRLPPPGACDSVRMRSSDDSKTVSFTDAEPRWVSANAVAGPDGRVELNLERFGSVPQIDENRPLFHGMSAIAYHEWNDIPMRLDVLESLLVF